MLALGVREVSETITLSLVRAQAFITWSMPEPVQYRTSFLFVLSHHIAPSCLDNLLHVNQVEFNPLAIVFNWLLHWHRTFPSPHCSLNILS